MKYPDAFLQIIVKKTFRKGHNPIPIGKRGTEPSRLETAFLLPNRAQQPAGGPDVFAARFLPFRLCSETVFDGNPCMAVPAGLEKRVECYGNIQRV